LLEMKIASVIGATGFVGSAIVRTLCGRGYTVRCSSRNPAEAAWLKDLAPSPEMIEICELNLSNGEPSAPVFDQMKEMMKDSTGVFFCAGFEKQEQATIDYMTSNALATIRAARESKVGCVVLTSSGGSTNPPGLTNEIPKNEIIHWSDPDAQVAANKFSPAAKTLMELRSLEEVGRNKANEIVNVELARNSPRLIIMNPNLILGPQAQPGPVKGNSLPWIVKILKKESMSEKIPNDSMSIIDVRDLAELHVSAMEKEDASGRYFGVNKSFTWEEILSTFEQVYPKYTMPPRFEGEAAVPTQFDHTRKKTLNVELRDLRTTLQDLVAFLVERQQIEP